MNAWFLIRNAKKVLQKKVSHKLYSKTNGSLESSSSPHWNTTVAKQQLKHAAVCYWNKDLVWWNLRIGFQTHPLGVMPKGRPLETPVAVAVTGRLVRPTVVVMACWGAEGKAVVGPGNCPVTVAIFILRSGFFPNTLTITI